MSDGSTLAMVLLAESEGPDLSSLESALRQYDAAAPPFLRSQESGQVITADWGQETVAATTLPHPFPWEKLEGPCACAWYWPEAASTLRHHQAQLMLHLVSSAGDVIGKAIRLTQLVAAASAVTPSLGILWAPAGLVHPVTPFQELAREATRELLPLHLWIDFRVEANESGSQRLFTTGMQALGHREIEVRHFSGEPRPLMDAVYNVAHYAIDKTKPLGDGDTLAVNDFQQVTIRHGSSMLDQATPVYELEF